MSITTFSKQARLVIAFPSDLCISMFLIISSFLQVLTMHHLSCVTDQKRMQVKLLFRFYEMDGLHSCLSLKTAELFSR